MNTSSPSNSSSATLKASRERKVFQAFLDQLAWPVGSVTSEAPPAPDVLYKPINGMPVAFELGELVDESFVQAIKALQNQNNTSRRPTSQPFPLTHANANLLVYRNVQNPLHSLLQKKLNKTYRSPYPIHLLMYWDGRAAPCQIVSLRWLRELCHQQTAEQGPFDGIWYWGEAGQPVQVWHKSCAAEATSQMITPKR